MNKKGKKLLLGTALALSVTAALSSGALAADYRFAGAADTEYYPSTCYEDLYGAQYNYGGMNAVDLEEPEQAFGFAGWSITGAAERVLLPDEIEQSGEYGLPFDDAPPVPAVMEAALAETQPAGATPVLQTPAYTSVQGMERPDGSVGYGGNKMPLRYVAEMFCDRIAASRIYLGDKYTDAAPYEYYVNSKGAIMIHPETGAELEKMLRVLRDEGEDAAFAYVRKRLKEDKQHKR